MKYLHFIAGELTNSATYFTTFADVSIKNHRNVKGTFGDGAGDTWKPWKYEDRVKDAKKAQEFWKEEVKKDVTIQTKRNHLTTYIAGCGSRQEDFPVVGKYIDHAKFEPLHGKNNTVKELFIKCMKIATTNSSFGKIKEFSKLSPSILFVKFVLFVRKNMSCNQLGKRMKSFFNDHKGKCDNDFSYRFRGQESRTYLKHFPEMCRILISFVGKEDKF